MDRIGIAVVGLGKISGAHLAELRNLEERVKLVAVVSRRGEAAEDAARRYGSRRFYTDYGRALEDPEVQAVVLCTPHHLHVPMAIEAAKAGKHVLVEKPLANTVEESDLAVAEAERHGVRLMVGYNQRFMGTVMEAKRRLETLGRLTHVVQIRGSSHRKEDIPEWWKSSEATGGLVLPVAGSHLIDTTLWWLGRKPHRVYAESAQHNPAWGGEDEVTLTMAFDGGLMATVHLSYNCKLPMIERIVIGTEGVLRISDNTRLWVNGELILTEPVLPFTQGGLSYRREMEEFLDAIRADREPLTSGSDTRATIEVMEAARVSMREHLPVTLAPPQ